MQISAHEFPPPRFSRRGFTTPVFKASSDIPPHNSNPSDEFSHDASRFPVLPKHERASAAKESILGDLSNYISLGSITTSLDATDRWPYDDWTEISAYSDVPNKQNDSNNYHIQALLHQNIFPKQYDLSNFQILRLIQHGWIRMFVGRHQIQEQLIVIRIYVLPDDVGRRFIHRDDQAFRKRLMVLFEHLDISSESWDGRKPRNQPIEQYRAEPANDDSLFYLFNTLSSPSPLIPDVSCSFAKDAMESLLGNAPLMRGLKTKLYPYQRRSAATMIRREVEPARTLDPRFEPFKNPAGRTFYYDEMTGILLREQRLYEESRGGILAEVWTSSRRSEVITNIIISSKTMGLGKTLICLTAILATKGHWPQIPPEFSIGLHPVRREVGTLMQMAASAVARARIPWRTYFQELGSSGEYHEACLALLEDNISSYIVPGPETRCRHGAYSTPEVRLILLCSATLVIVPPNLLMQWKTEIELHFEEESLKVLYLNSQDPAMPSVRDLLPYDIIVMTKQRFEREMATHDVIRRSSEVDTHCTCPYNYGCHCSARTIYRSPLKDLHFLRIIVDEGHDFASSGGKTDALWALQNIHVERRWVVSGTPASGLFGVEIGLAAQETFNEGQENEQLTNRILLEIRRRENARLQEVKDLEKLGRIVVGFLNLRPWANSKAGKDPASWQKYVMPSKDGRRKVRSLKAILQSLVVRHQIQDIEADIRLPPLHNLVVYLKPSWHDKLSINLFVLTLTANAVTSERVDEDYMFHSKNRGQLNQLITNLRQSGFFWTGFSPEDVIQTLDVCHEYLKDNKRPESIHRDNDRVLLEHAMAMGVRALESPSWTAFAKLQEIGIFIEDFPLEARNAWSLVPRQTENQPLLVGTTQFARAQDHVNSNLYASNPGDGLAQLGFSVMERAWQNVQKAASVQREDASNMKAKTSPSKAKARGPLHSSLVGHPELKEKSTISKARAIANMGKGNGFQEPNHMDNSSYNSKPTGLKSALKSSLKSDPIAMIPSDSILAKTRLSGTASAKLTYLLDRVIELQQDEKILIFYEGDHIAYYIAQAFELLNIRYLIYTGTLPVIRLNAYVTTFNTTETFRVMLMNIHQAAHGLHLASASRVFFVNPVWQPNVEAQAIKRAHRIGQTRPVYVETLVLEDTLEDKMLKRRKGMNAQEHQQAERSLLDDPVMGQIIRDARFIPLSPEEIYDVHNQIANLKTPQQVFGRVAQGAIDSGDPDADLIFPEGYSQKPKQSRKRKSVF